MTEHVADDLLVAFCEGEIEEDLAILVAEHLDSCPMCATRSAAMEPLAAVFATVDDPVPPALLAASILEELERPQRAPATEMIVASALLTAAGLLLFAGNPVAAAVQLGIVMESLGTAASVLTSQVSASAVAMSLSATTCALFGLFAVRLAATERRLL